MPPPEKHPPTLRSNVLGELVFDPDCRGYGPPGEWDPDERSAGAPHFVAWASTEDRFVAADFVAELDRTWASLVGRAAPLLKACIPIIAETLESECGLEAGRALEIAGVLANPDRIAMVKLNLTQSFKVNRHELVLHTDGFDDETGGHDLTVCFLEDFTPDSVYLDG